MNSEEFLYLPPLSALVDRPQITRAWHKRMLKKYKLTGRELGITVSRWLLQAGVSSEEMERYGVGAESDHYGLTSDAYINLFDHGHVIQRRDDGALFVLGEPYADPAKLQDDPIVKLWRGLGSTVRISADSGWFPGSSAMVLISEPPSMSLPEVVP
jgi:hypothetical protein